MSDWTRTPFRVADPAGHTCVNCGAAWSAHMYVDFPECGREWCHATRRVRYRYRKCPFVPGYYTAAPDDVWWSVWGAER